MKNLFKSSVLSVFAVLVSITALFAWGAWGHYHINRAAIFALPEPMRVFFYNHIDFITEESVMPDIRKYTINDRAESPRHFINVESFGVNNIGDLPKTMKEAKAAFADTLLQKAGLLPWYIQEITDKLTTAMKEKRKPEILFLAGDLGHYLADAHMPLHTALNHDGQLTGQKGIHAFWESQLPEMFGENYNFNTGEAKYIDNITGETFNIIESSHRLVDTLLSTERNLKNGLPQNKIYKSDSAGNILKNKYNQPVHTYEYAKQYHELLNGMVEQQLRRSIIATANFWYTAWVNAGKPNLVDLDPENLTNRNKKNYKRDLKLWKKGKLFGFKVQNEF